MLDTVSMYSTGQFLFSNMPIKNANKPVSLGRVAEHQSIIDWLITGNNYGPLTQTPDPLDVHHCTVPTGGLPLHVFLFAKLVPRVGLEPTHISTPEPKSGASTNFATWA